MDLNEIKKISNGIVQGDIFTDRQVKSEHVLPMVFMPLIFLEDEDRKKFLADPPAMVYAYMKDAGPRSLNGNPIFMACSMIQDQRDVVKILRRVARMRKIMGMDEEENLE